MKPKKKIIDAAIANGSIDRLNMLLSAAHLLNCEANNLVEEASDLMAENSLLLGDLKKLHNDFVKVADISRSSPPSLLLIPPRWICSLTLMDLIKHSESGLKYRQSGNLEKFVGTIN